MTKKDENSFSKGLGVIAGLAGLLIGIGAASEDPEMNAWAGAFFGFLIGYVAGWVVGEFLTMVFKIVLGIVCMIIILLRVYNLFNLLF